MFLFAMFINKYRLEFQKKLEGCPPLVKSSSAQNRINSIISIKLTHRLMLNSIGGTAYYNSGSKF